MIITIDLHPTEFIQLVKEYSPKPVLKEEAPIVSRASTTAPSAELEYLSDVYKKFGAPTKD